MNSKLEIDRELAQKVDDLLYIMTGHDSYPRLVHKYGKEWWTPINEMRAEICTLLAAPVVERQEPIYQFSTRMQHTKKAWLDIDKESFDEYTARGGDWITRTLYAEQPAPVAVVLPAKQFSEVGEDYLQADWVSGWNACLDKVKELNQ